MLEDVRPLGAKKIRWQRFAGDGGIAFECANTFLEPDSYEPQYLGHPSLRFVVASRTVRLLPVTLFARMSGFRMRRPWP